MRILRHYALRMGMAANFSIFDSADQTRLLKEAIKSLDISSDSFQPSAVHSAISKAKNQLKTAEIYAQTAGDFFEHALVHGDYKGTARQSVEPQLAAGKDVLLEIDWQGARQIRAKVPDAVSVFILPPSRQALETRMRQRGQDSEEVIGKRLAAAREEMSHFHEFDFVIVNDRFETAVAELQAIFVACRLRRPVQAERHATLIRALLA